MEQVWIWNTTGRTEFGSNLPVTYIYDRDYVPTIYVSGAMNKNVKKNQKKPRINEIVLCIICLLYTSDAADE